MYTLPQKVVRPGSIDSLHRGFVTSQICPVGWSKIKKKRKILSAIIISENWSWSVEKKRKKKKGNIWKGHKLGL